MKLALLEWRADPEQSSPMRVWYTSKEKARQAARGLRTTFGKVAYEITAISFATTRPELADFLNRVELGDDLGQGTGAPTHKGARPLGVDRSRVPPSSAK